MSYIVFHQPQLGSLVLDTSQVENVSDFMKEVDDMMAKHDPCFIFELYMIGDLDVYKEYAPFHHLQSMSEFRSELNQWVKDYYGGEAWL